jgi:hypothetical protein
MIPLLVMVGRWFRKPMGSSQPGLLRAEARSDTTHIRASRYFFVANILPRCDRCREQSHRATGISLKSRSSRAGYASCRCTVCANRSTRGIDEKTKHRLGRTAHRNRSHLRNAATTPLERELATKVPPKSHTFDDKSPPIPGAVAHAIIAVLADSKRF